MGGGCLNIITLVLDLYSLLDSEAPLTLYTSQTITELNSGCTAEQGLVKSFEMLPFICSYIWLTWLISEDHSLSQQPISVWQRPFHLAEIVLELVSLPHLPPCVRFAFQYLIPFSRYAFFFKVNMPSDGLSQVTWTYPLSPKGHRTKICSEAGQISFLQYNMDKNPDQHLQLEHSDLHTATNVRSEAPFRGAHFPELQVWKS